MINVYISERAPKTARPDFLIYTSGSILDWWGDKTLADMRARTCDEYVRWRTGKGVSDQTARHDLKTLRTAIHYYHANYGPLDAVPVVTLPARSPPRIDYWLTRQQVAQRIRAARRNPRWRHLVRMYLIGIYTGSRPGITLRLRWLPSTEGGWFDLEAETLHRRARGKIESTKRAPAARIHKRLLPHLRRWRAADMALGITHVVHYQGRPITKLRHSWKAVARAAGHEAETEGPHVLRHTCCTWLLQSGVDPYEVAGYLGMSIDTLMKVYGHHAPSHQHNAATSRGRPRIARDTP